MEFFNALIKSTEKILDFPHKKSLSVNENDAWKENSHSIVLMMRDTAFELKGVGFNLVTEDTFEDEISLYGKDLYEIKNDTAFARVCIVSIDKETDEQKLYNLIRKIEYVKYKFFPDGYMIRCSSDAQKEAVRVSKSSVKQGVSFENIGSLLIRSFKKISGVKAIKVIFVTDENAPIQELSKIARKSDDITKALNHVMNSVNFDCDSCGLKAICDEVEGMKEMHFKRSGM